MCHSRMDGHGLLYLFRQFGRPIAATGTSTLHINWDRDTLIFIPLEEAWPWVYSQFDREG
jgi:hypothetical protein